MSADSQSLLKLLRNHTREVRGRENAQLIRDEDHETFDKQHENFDSNTYHSRETQRARVKAGRPHRTIRYYTVLGDPSLAIFINDAKAKAWAAYNGGMRFWYREYVLSGIAFISVRLAGRCALIRIMPADSFEFEFASSSMPIKTWTSTQGSISFEAYRGVHVNVHVGLVQGKMTTSAQISTQKRSVSGTGADTSINKRPPQVELISEPVVYTTPQDKVNRKRYPYALYESFAPASPHSGIFSRAAQSGTINAAFLSIRTPLLAHMLRDKGFDVPFEDSVNLDAIRSAFIRTDADWPRAMGKQVVVDGTFGEREFAIYIDAYNQFHIFPTAAIEPLNVVDPYLQNVPVMFVTMLTPTIPAWCYKQTALAIDLPPADWSNGNWLVDQPEPDWKLNHIGTRAAAIFYEREAYVRDDTLFDSADGTGAPDPFTTADFNTLRDACGIHARHNLTFNTGYNDTRYFVAPGIIEVTINISLTGFDLNQYVATLDVREVRRPTTAEYCSMAVGYVWHDVPFGAKVVKNKAGVIVKDERIAKAGDFVTWDIESYYTLDTAVDYLPISLFSLKRLVENPEYGQPAEVEIMTPVIGPIYAIDFTTLSWAQQAALYERYTDTPADITRTVPCKTGDSHGPYSNVPWSRFVPGVAVYVGTRLKQMLFPEKATEADRTAVRNVHTGNEQIGPFAYRTNLEAFFAEELKFSRTWIRMPLDDPTNWGTGNYNAWRLSQLGGHLVGPHAPPADAATIAKYCLYATYTYLPPTHSYYSASFKFAWYTYGDLICNHYIFAPDTTFYVHPSGTWAFFNNTEVFASDGMTPVFTTLSNQLDSFDPEKTVEHIIFDHVHFEMRTNNILLGTLDTTFQELHNRAVRAGKLAETLDEGIEEIKDADLRGVFSKDIYTVTTPGYTDITWLDLKLVWNGVSYWYPESGIQGGAYHSPGISGLPGGILGLTMNHPWFTAPAYGGNIVYPALHSKHVRFANPIVLQTEL